MDDAIWCDGCQRFHERRDRRVPCANCDYPTDAPHRICPACVAAGQQLVVATPTSLRALLGVDA